MRPRGSLGRANEPVCRDGARATALHEVVSDLTAAGDLTFTGGGGAEAHGGGGERMVAVNLGGYSEIDIRGMVVAELHAASVRRSDDMRILGIFCETAPPKAERIERANDRRRAEAGRDGTRATRSSR